MQLKPWRVVDKTDFFEGYSLIKKVSEKGRLDSELLLQKPWKERSPVDRRSEGDTRRRDYDRNIIKYEGCEKRRRKDRRQDGERRDGWLRNRRWSSIQVFDR
jgi:hypothetical protein